MSIENITEKILSEANNIAESSLNNANCRSSEIINEAKKKAEDIIEEALNKYNSEAETLKSRKISAAELQARKMLLSAKQEAIKKSFDTALDKLTKMPEDKYINFIAEEIKKVPNCKGEVILNERDRIKIGERLIKAVNDSFKESKVVLSSKTVKSSGGFVLKNGDIEINSTFETILNSIKDGLTFEVANVLFK